MGPHYTQSLTALSRASCSVGALLHPTPSTPPRAIHIMGSLNPDIPEGLYPGSDIHSQSRPNSWGPVIPSPCPTPEPGALYTALNAPPQSQPHHEDPVISNPHSSTEPASWLGPCYTQLMPLPRVSHIVRPCCTPKPYSRTCCNAAPTMHLGCLESPLISCHLISPLCLSPGCLGPAALPLPTSPHGRTGAMLER